MSYKCPHCEEEIEILQYREDAITYGTYNIETQDYNQNETESNGESILECPECGEIIESVDNLINTESEEGRRRLRERLRERERSRTNDSIRLTLDEPSPSPNPPNLPDSWNQIRDRIQQEEELPVPPAIDQNWRGEYSGFHNSHNTPKPSEILVCPNCNQKIEAKIDETVECYNCNKEFNRETAKKIIPIDNN